MTTQDQVVSALETVARHSAIAQSTLERVAGGDVAAVVALRLELIELYEAFLKVPDCRPTVHDMPDFPGHDRSKAFEEQLQSVLTAADDLRPKILVIESKEEREDEIESLVGHLLNVDWGLAHVVWSGSVHDMDPIDALWAPEFQFWTNWGESLLAALSVLHKLEVPTAAH
jgi:hypothetical protein